MNHLLNGFSSELTKIAIAKRLIGAGKMMFKHPVSGIMIPMTAATSIAAGSAAYKTGRSGVKGRYLNASSRGAGEGAYKNFHGLFKHKPTAKDLKKLHGNYRESAFTSGRPSTKSHRKAKKKD